MKLPLLRSSQPLFANLTANHPEKVFDWLQNNENDFVVLFSVTEQQFERKVALFQSLSVLPDWKWTAYEAGMKLVKESMRPQDKWSSIGLVQTVAQSSPQDAITYTLAQHNGAVDSSLLNGALIEYAKIAPLEAKSLLLENQAYADAYGLANSLKNKEVIESVVTSTAEKLHSYGSDKIIDFLATLPGAALKSGYKNDPEPLPRYLGKMKFNDKELAAEVEQVIGYMKGI